VRCRTFALSTCALAFLGACGEEGASTERFCEEIRTNRDAILTVPATANEIDEFVGLYRQLGTAAPLAIEQEWDDLVVNYETASTVEPGDSESVQRAVETALRAESSAVAVRDWVSTNCQVDLPEVATLQPAPTTTVAVTPSTGDEGGGG